MPRKIKAYHACCYCLDLLDEGLILVLLITVGKSAIIENIPMQAAYILLFLLNFTNIFEKKTAAKEAVAA